MVPHSNRYWYANNVLYAYISFNFICLYSLIPKFSLFFQQKLYLSNLLFDALLIQFSFNRYTKGVKLSNKQEIKMVVWNSSASHLENNKDNSVKMR